jgi:hypothetical protein
MCTKKDCITQKKKKKRAENLIELVSVKLEATNNETQLLIK